MPPGFNLGVLNNMEEAKKILEFFFEENGIDKPNSVLRNLVNEGREGEIAPPKTLSYLCEKMMEASYKGLSKRGKGEEKLLI